MSAQILNEAPLPSMPNPQLATEVEVRHFPYPYRAMLAICSDLDETPNAETYFERMRFLNTTEETSMGIGVGLEVGNSMYFDMPPGHFSYWNAGEKDRERIRTLIKSGHIDCLHSFGDLALTRAHAARALDELERNDCHLRVWVDHAVATTNFGSDIMRGHGDEIGHPGYHADLTLGYGIRYIWRGRVTSVIGQERLLSLEGIANWRYPLRSATTIAKEAAKIILAKSGNQKYSLHSDGHLSQPARLRNGCEVNEFMRCSPHWAGLDHPSDAAGMGEILSGRFLDRLVERQGFGILYTHLGKLAPGKCFDPATVLAFRKLADYHRSGKVLVTTTRRLLDYWWALNNGTVTHGQNDQAVFINLKDEGQPQGLTFYIDERPTFAHLNGSTTLPLQPNGRDENGRSSVSVVWPQLQFPL